MKSLTMNPGRFDSLVNRIVNSVKPYLDQPSQSQQIATMIIQQVHIFYPYFQFYSHKQRYDSNY